MLPTARDELATAAGTVGLLVAGLFAATMSCMDSALNKTAGIFVRSVYRPLLARRNRETDDTRQLWVGKLVSLVSGFLAIGAALFFVSMQDLSLFQLMMKFSTMIQMPLFVPLILCFFVRRTPVWAPWATVAFGFGIAGNGRQDRTAIHPHRYVCGVARDAFVQ